MTWLFYITLFVVCISFFVSGFINMLLSNKRVEAYSEMAIGSTSPKIRGGIKVGAAILVLLPSFYLHITGYCLMVAILVHSIYYNFKYGIGLMNVFSVSMLSAVVVSAGLDILTLQ